VRAGVGEGSGAANVRGVTWKCFEIQCVLRFSRDLREFVP
jgi:hypothetical protein